MELGATILFDAALLGEPTAEINRNVPIVKQSLKGDADEPAGLQGRVRSIFANRKDPLQNIVKMSGKGTTSRFYDRFELKLAEGFEPPTV